MIPQSTARVRTKTGCFPCEIKTSLDSDQPMLTDAGRQRRKKCDETRPRCRACTRNELGCQWPSGNEQRDGRRAQRCRISAVSDLRLSPLVPLPAPFQLQEHGYLYRYYASTLVPRLVRKNSLARFLDQTHFLRLAWEFPPLMGAMISIAGMQLASSSRWAIQCAIESYIYTISGLQKTIAQLRNPETNDGLLATVISLSVFESCRRDAVPNTTPHVMASGTLLALRRPRGGNCPQTAAVFDRICIESFVYHASLMMIFDPSLDALSRFRDQQDLTQYFPDHPDLGVSVSTQPILHAPYRFFVLIADATKLARLSRPLERGERQKWRHLQDELRQCVPIMRTEDEQSSTLYCLGLQVLLLKKNPGISLREMNRQMSICLERGLEAMALADAERYFTSFLLWPLAILGSIAVFSNENQTVQDLLSLLINTRPGGQATWVQRRLQTIWTTTRSPDSESREEQRLLGLQLLLDGN
ncbi:fungal Zn binuclear cluster domain-containing protein [Penicillium riverlandense]|uniref:fungal Zn binuclear cluster domain-containing protein n=1 Tax=Penicillium riverlandense TaxID=1903569 RepID=UPI00254937D3|nr:fungal Zn binuclear cluster domain-containing protein [Penicillium riverlandense]KAJ5831710.1 fungal Zn binuclear cluster domain-containing protein [Penicillium riverlandense]